MPKSLAKHNDTDIAVYDNKAIAGFRIGILVIDINYPLFPGNVANATTFDFPVTYKVLKGVSVEQIINGDPALLDKVISAGQELIEQGVQSIVGACGSFAYYQKETAAALNVPIFLSNMLQVPLILQSLKPQQKLGIIAASKSSITDKVYEQCNINDTSRLQITGALEIDEFHNLLANKDFNNEKLKDRLVELVKQFVSENSDIGALLLQCSELPPYAFNIQQHIKLPVFDVTTMIKWIYTALVRNRFNGYI